jgi:hypothetical protein
MRVSVLSVACVWTLALHLPAAAQTAGSAPAAAPAPAPLPAAKPAPDAPAPSTAPSPAVTPAVPTAPQAPSPAATPDAGSESAAPLAPAPTTSEAAACVPGCRSGFLCLQGQCVSACNPLCSIGQICVVRAEQAECLASSPIPGMAGMSTQPRYFPGPVASPPPDPSAERHDGLMLRVTLGFGGAGAKQTNADVDLSSEFVQDRKTTFSGAGTSLSVDVGGPVGENIILHGRASAFMLERPSLQIDGADYGRTKHSFAGAFLLAPAVSYYFMPVNLYVTGAAGLSFMGMRYWDRAGEEQKRVTEAGIGLNFDIGKEWWAAPQWGLGVAGRLWYSRISDQRSIGRLEYEFAGAAVLFSATYQ